MKAAARKSKLKKRVNLSTTIIMLKAYSDTPDLHMKTEAIKAVAKPTNPRNARGVFLSFSSTRSTSRTTRAVITTMSSGSMLCILMVGGTIGAISILPFYRDRINCINYLFFFSLYSSRL